MPIDVYVVSRDPKSGVGIQLPDRRIDEFLGDFEESTAVRIQELLTALTDTLEKCVKRKSNITIEISGSVDLKGKGGVQWLLFNVGGETSKSNTMKVTVETTVEPKQ